MDPDLTTMLATAIGSIMRTFKEMVEEKCATAKEAVKERAEERIKSKKVPSFGEFVQKKFT